LSTLQRRSLAFHWRGNLAVVLGVAVATAILTGALLVGDSMQASLRSIAIDRLGPIDDALVSNRFLRAELPGELAATEAFAASFDRAVPAILLSGSVSHAASTALVGRTNVYAVNRGFWSLVHGSSAPQADGRGVVLNRSLADELGAAPGDDVLLRVGQPTGISPETLLGRRDRTAAGARLTVEAVIPDDGMASFSLRPDQRSARNAFIPLDFAQRWLDQAGRINAILVSRAAGSPLSFDGAAELQRILENQATLADFELRLRVDSERRYVSLESDRFLIEPPIEAAARTTADELEIGTTSILAYLANAIALEGVAEASRDGAEFARDATHEAARRAVPYSTVAGVSSTGPSGATFTSLDGNTIRAIDQGTIVINDWVAAQIGAKSGGRIRLEYYAVGPFGELQTRQALFDLAAIVRMDGTARDAGWTPEYPGVTDVDTIAAWDPPFPVDLDRVTDADETYWQQHRATPKAFVSLVDAQRLWAPDADRFGRLTAVRFYAAADADVDNLATRVEQQLLRRTPLEALGLRFQPVKQRALEAAKGSTDFSGLFIGFSLFLIASALMLVALLFRLNAERRAAEIGLLEAVGFAPGKVAGLMLVEGAVLVLIGGLIGLLGAAGFAWLMLEGLRSWWLPAVQTSLLRLHVGTASMSIGYVSSIVVALGAVRWSMRGMARLPVHVLMAGAVGASDSRNATATGGAPGTPGRTASIVALIAVVSAAASIAAPALTDALDQSIAFFACGAATLVAALAGLSRWMQKPDTRIVHRPGFRAVPMLGIRNISRHRGRSLLTVGLVGSATFVIAAIEAFRIDVDPNATDRHSGTGGFTLLAEAAVPIHRDLNTRSGRLALGVADDDLHAKLTVVPFRLREGEETSCLNLYKPSAPRILGATRTMIDRGGFSFSTWEKGGDSVNENPWALLDKPLPDGAVPVIGDEAAVLWQLHSGLGKDLSITDERGRTVRLRFVALLKGSALQSELIIAEADFTDLFPSESGYRFFLIDTPADQAAAVTRSLEQILSTYGFDVSSTTRRLVDFSAVQNTYLSTFQTLGGLGLMLGTLGLAAVLLRNVWERRSELALLRALGFSPRALGWLVLSENTALVVAGLLCGAIPAAIAALPHILGRAVTLPWASLGLTLLGVLVVGVAGGAVALMPALRTPLLNALRTE
jgi:ABC-type antimicrobial peptide transport system permease subunit